jgi:hypothetical protein
MFIASWNCPSLRGHQIYHYTDEFSACQDTCAYILEAISKLKFRNHVHIEEAREINELIELGKLEDYREAIQRWNGSELNHDNDPEYWACYSEEILKPKVPEILSEDFFEMISKEV